MSGARPDGVGERQLVRRIQHALGGPVPGVLVGPGDDAAVVRCQGRIVLTVDTQQEGTHFERAWLSAQDLGRRALAVSVSDLAAMGSRPLCALCSLVLPVDLDQAWLDDLVSGLHAAGREFGAPVVGGDVTRGERVGIGITAIGELDEGRQPILRSGARAGDMLVVAGRLGLAAAGRLAIRTGRDAELPAAAASYRRPQPLSSLALGIATACHAMIDVSDGLAVDLARLCEASAVGARLDATALVDDELRTAAAALQADAMELAVHGGDDYALLLAVPAGGVQQVLDAARARRVKAARVGEVAEPPGIVLVEAGGGERELAAVGWDPFAAGDRR